MSPLRRALAVAVIFTAALAPVARADVPFPPSQWYGLPGLNAASGAQWVRAIAHGSPPTTVYAGLEGGGVFRSTTGGATWSSFNSGFPNPLTTNVRALLTSSAGTTVYAGTDAGLYKSTGGAWQPLAQGAEADPNNPKKLNQSVQSLLELPGGVMLAGVFSGGVHKSPDGGATWQPPAPDNGMPKSETVYGLTSNVPGVVYATAGSGVYVSIDAGSSWTRMSDGIPSIASPITTWAYPQQPQILFTSTGSNGIYRSLNGGVTWAPINDGLGAVRARGFQIFPAAQGAHLYAATEDGLWEALQANSFIAPAPRWRAVTQDGLIEPGASNVIMWSLTAPVIPGAGAPGLIAGTQSNGGYFLGFEPPDSACPGTHASNTSADCPHLNDASPTEGQTLVATDPGDWTGTELIEFAYQWQRCTGTTDGSCTDVPGAEETTMVVPDLAAQYRYRVVVTATNPAPTFGTVQRESAYTGLTAESPASRPGNNQIHGPGITVNSPGETTDPQVGDTMYAADGITPSLPTRDAWFNPPASTYSFQWLRCELGGGNCETVAGANARTYTLTPADGTRTMRVEVTGTASGYSTTLTSGPSYDVESAPAAIAPPLPPDTPGGAARSQAPALTGEAYVGETLAGSVGGWVDPTTDFLRRWVRCDASGGSCTYIQKVASTDPEDGSTYRIRADDLGSTLRMRVTADVNNDLTPDGLDNHLPHSVEVDTPPSAAVTTRSVPGPPPPGGGGGGPDLAGPVLGGLSVAKAKVVAGKAAVLRFTTSEGGTVRAVVARRTKGRKSGGRCRPLTRKNRKKKKCSFYKTAKTVTKAGVAPGEVVLRIRTRQGKKKLAPGRYRATVTVLDAAGNASNTLRVKFRIVRR
ncbi:MAG TPA: hypothetical protein VD836_13475 [Solirubrobacteraceae bacterium]|nr:hypothetical protein [Solirubrobacteraceae bacterium]